VGAVGINKSLEDEQTDKEVDLEDLNHKKAALLNLLGLEESEDVDEPTEEELKFVRDIIDKNDYDFDEKQEEQFLDEVNKEETFGDIPILTCTACRTQLEVKTSSGDICNAKVYVDPGAEGTFIGRAFLKKLGHLKIITSGTSFKGAVEGRLGNYVLLEVRPTPNHGFVTITAYIHDEFDHQAYGDILLGLPACINLGLEMKVSNETFILKFGKHGVEKEVKVVKTKNHVGSVHQTYLKHFNWKF